MGFIYFTLKGFNNNDDDDSDDATAMTWGDGEVVVQRATMVFMMVIDDSIFA